MCGRFTVKATWAELVALYRLTMDAPPHNLRPRYNVCPTDPVDVVTGRTASVNWSDALGPHPALVEQNHQRREDGDVQRQGRDNRDQAVLSRCVQADALPHPNVRVLRMAEHAGRKAALVFHGARWLAAPHSCRSLGRMERSPDRRAAEVLHDDHHRAERVRCGDPRPDAGVLDGGAIRAVAQRGGGSWSI